MIPPTTLFFFLALLAPGPSLSDNYVDAADCYLHHYPCGSSIYDIHYPFRLQDSPAYCGHPQFGDLYCSMDNETLLTRIGKTEYQVNQSDYTYHLLRITDMSVLAVAPNDPPCPRPPSTNISLNSALFSYSGFDTNLTVYFNCKPDFPLPSVLHNITCSDSEYGNKSFYRLPGEPPPPVDVWDACDSMVIVPVNRTAAASDFAAAVRGGFGLTWKVSDEVCIKCTMSNGICGNNPSSGAAVCLCSNATSINGGCVPIKENKKGAGGKTIIAIFSIVGVGFLLVCLSLALYFYKQRKISSIIFWKKDLSKNQNIEAFLKEYGALAPKRYSYSDVKKITKSFQEKLGQGGFGTVFKGTISNGRVVAVKMLNDSEGDGDEFINEVASIGRTFHVNIVSLLGFCSEGSKRALIYDFMCNGSLEKLIYSEKPKTTLDWDKLYQIAIGIARGLEYLHRGCIRRIVHFDIKPHNILLDQDFSPKISDFGLAKLCLKKDSIISIAGARGTIGYIAPEVFSRNFGVVSSKSDVYSYGMMVLEIAGGRKNVNAGVENSSEAYFPHWIYEHLDRNGDLLAYGVDVESEETVKKMILVGLWCIQTKPQNRPPMSRVIEMLEGSVHDLQVPPKPHLSSSPLGSLNGTSSIEDICWDDCDSSVHS